MNLDRSLVTLSFSAESHQPSVLQEATSGEAAGEQEWIGGIFTEPIRHCCRGETYFPDGLFWINQTHVLGELLDKPGTVLARAGESLRDTIAQPLAGPPRRPQRVRVCSEGLARVLRDAHPGLEIVVAPTPEIDELEWSTRRRWGLTTGDDHSYLDSRIEPERVASFFQAATALFERDPWRAVPLDQPAFSLSLPDSLLHDLVILFPVPGGTVKEILFFSSTKDARAYVDAQTRPGTVSVPAHLGLAFEPAEALTPMLREEIAEHGWQAAEEAHPWLSVRSVKTSARCITAEDFTVAEATLRALTALLADEPDLAGAWQGGRSVQITTKVIGELMEEELVVLRAPYQKEAVPLPSRVAPPPSIGELARPGISRQRRKSQRQAARKARRKNR